jgi:hypothetical protein
MIGWVILCHDQIPEAFLVQKRKVKNFIELNKKVWEDYKIDVTKFTEQPVSIKDKHLSEIYQETYPEMML